MTTPIARCPKHDVLLEFSQDYLGRWQCECPDEVDGDYTSDGLRATYVIGEGLTPQDALEDWAQQKDIDPKELLCGR